MPDLTLPNRIEVYLRPDKAGTQVNMKVSPGIEEFFQSLVPGGEQKNAHEMWERLGGGTERLKMYDIGSQILSMEERNRERYGPPVYSLTNSVDLADGYGTVNLSILRLVGASGPDGLKFLIKRQVFSPQYLSELEGTFGRAIKQFFNDHFKPHGMKVVLSTESW